MSYIDTSPLQHNTVFSIYADREEIKTDPEYQRNGDIWTTEKKQLLIDSILNRYDIPKIYFHKYDIRQRNKSGFDYAIIDGRQRLEAIWGFIEGKYTLGEDFRYYKDTSVDAKNLTYNELAKSYPKLKNRFDSTSLPIIQVETDDIDLIEDMFSRLNEAVPLNAPEKRNSFGGDMVKAINSTSQTNFFKTKVKFSNKRFQHKESAVRLLYLEHHLKFENKIVDTKKPYLDLFTKKFKSNRLAEVKDIKTRTQKKLQLMFTVFIDSDTLLRTQSVVPLYYLLFAKAVELDLSKKITRAKLLKFNKSREANRASAEADIGEADYELLEYDRLSQQGTNDASSIKYRLGILAKHILNVEI